MAEHDRFELELAAALCAYAEDAPTQVRPTELAHRFATAYPHRRIALGRWAFGLTPAVAWTLILTGLLLTSAIIGALIAGGLLPLRPVTPVPAIDTTVSPAPSPSSAPSPSPVPLVHVQKWSLSFDYPETWTLTDGPTETGPLRPEQETLGFVGNGSAATTCTTPPKDPTSWWPPTTTCTTTWRLVDDSIVIRFEGVSSDGSSPPRHWTDLEVLAGTDLPGAESLTIDGLPARLAKSATNVVPYADEAIPGATEVLWWGLPSRVANGNVYGYGWQIVAAIRGPDVAEMEGQAEAMVAGIHFVPETVMLPTDPVALRQAGAAALATFFAEEHANANDEHNHDLDCFPREVGSHRATITQIPFGGSGPLTKPLPVTCAIESLEPNAMQGWTLVLSQSWVAGPDYPAGLVRWRFALGPGEGLGGLIYPDLKTSGPLWPHMGPSKYGP